MAQRVSLGDLPEEWLWRKYCGFMELTVAEWQAIQDRLLEEQLELVAASPWRGRLEAAALEGVEAFRASAPLTVYEDYRGVFEARDAAALPVTPSAWAYTTGAGGQAKWAPYTARAVERLADSALAAFIAAAAREVGEVRVRGGERVLYNVAPPPYLAGLMARALTERFGLRPVPPLEVGERLEFHQRIEAGFREALCTGVDVVCSLSSVLVRMGEYFLERTRAAGRGPRWHPAALGRVAWGRLVSGLHRRPLLPRDLWRARAILGWGLDTSVYRQQIATYWGREPYEFYACTEAGVTALQALDGEGLVPLPYTAFLEFLPEEEGQRATLQPGYRPETLLLAEGAPGQRYELVRTSLYGMPFQRYRTGHLLRVVRGAEGGRVPRLVQVGRSDSIVDLAGFTRLDEKTLWEAVARTGGGYAEWAARKEFDGGKPVLHLYLEGAGQADPTEVAEQLHQSLTELDPSYRDLATMLKLRPVRVSLLAPGSLRTYYHQQANGRGWLPRINPPPASLEALLAISLQLQGRERAPV